MGCMCNRYSEDEDKLTAVLGEQGLLRTMTEATKLGSRGEQTKIVRTHASRQKESARSHFSLDPISGRLHWTKTHFILALDSSKAMTGRRWKGVLDGFQMFLQYLLREKEVVVSAFTFDEEVTPYIKEQQPSKVKAMQTELPFTSGSDRKYGKALSKLLGLMATENAPDFQDYLPCVLFVSTGKGGYPEEEMSSLMLLKSEGKDFLFFSFACETEGDADMERIASGLNGEHFRITEADCLPAAFVLAIASP
jgi:uncharacterized protein YegL